MIGFFLGEVVFLMLTNWNQIVLANSCNISSGSESVIEVSYRTQVVVVFFCVFWALVGGR